MTYKMFEVGDRFVLKASYCSDNNQCNDESPCTDCLDMCNVFTVSAICETISGYDYFFGGHWANIDGGHLLDTPMCSVLTSDINKVDGLRYIHHVNDAIKLPS